MFKRFESWLYSKGLAYWLFLDGMFWVALFAFGMWMIA